jgi:hypothetical protein
MTRMRTSLATLILALMLPTLGLGVGCKNRKQADGTLAELVAPKDARPWESRFAVAFDNSYTPTALNLQGRAPNDVLDQQLFQARLGHADVIVLVRVAQVWGKGRYQGRHDQFVELEVGEALLGNLPKDTPDHLMIQVSASDELPGSLQGRVMLLYVRWDPGSEPPYRHHLMPADEDVVALIKAMVKHAQAEGVLDAKGAEKKSGKRRRGRKAKKRGAEVGPPSAPGDSEQGIPGAEPGDPVPIGSDLHDPPPSIGPEPDASTGLQNLGDDPRVDDPRVDDPSPADANPTPD